MIIDILTFGSHIDKPNRWFTFFKPKVHMWPKHGLKQPACLEC